MSMFLTCVLLVLCSAGLSAGEDPELHVVLQRELNYFEAAWDGGIMSELLRFFTQNSSLLLPSEPTVEGLHNIQSVLNVTVSHVTILDVTIVEADWLHYGGGNETSYGFSIANVTSSAGGSAVLSDLLLVWILVPQDHWRMHIFMPVVRAVNGTRASSVVQHRRGLFGASTAPTPSAMQPPILGRISDPAVFAAVTTQQNFFSAAYGQKNLSGATSIYTSDCVVLAEGEPAPVRGISGVFAMLQNDQQHGITAITLQLQEAGDVITDYAIFSRSTYQVLAGTTLVDQGKTLIIWRNGVDQPRVYLQALSSDKH